MLIRFALVARKNEQVSTSFQQNIVKTNKESNRTTSGAQKWNNFAAIGNQELGKVKGILQRKGYEIKLTPLRDSTQDTARKTMSINEGMN